MDYSSFEKALIDQLSDILNAQIASTEHPLRSYYENNPFSKRLFYRDMSYKGFLAANLEQQDILGYVKAYATQMLGFGFNVIIFLDEQCQSKTAFWEAMCTFSEEKLRDIFGSCLKTYSYMMYDYEVEKANKAISLMVRQYISLAGELCTDPKMLCIFNELMFFVGVAIATDKH